MKIDITNICGLLLIGMLLTNCRNDQAGKPGFVPTAYAKDTLALELKQLVTVSSKGDFIAIYHSVSSNFGSGNTLMKLYSKDSISVDECLYGSHPLALTDWNDTTLVIKCAVSSVHGNKAYRRWYLDNSVDKNDSIGYFKIRYMKNY